MLWKLSKGDIEEWMYLKYAYFMQKDTKGFPVDYEKWKERYIYSDLHEIFFDDFPCICKNW